MWTERLWKLMLTAIVTILIFLIMISLHEFGHFIFGKLLKFTVLEYAIGFGPAIFKKQKGETLYTLRVLPIGGFCAFEGEDESSDSPRSFNNAAIWKKIIILAAGGIMNLILGFILVVLVTSLNGNRPDENGVRPEHYITSTTIGRFYPDAMSEKTGLQVGDTIIAVNGMKVYVDGDVSYQFARDTDGVFDMTVLRGGVKVDLEDVTFDLIQNEDGSQRIIIDFLVEPIKKTPNYLFYSILTTLHSTTTTHP